MMVALAILYSIVLLMTVCYMLIFEPSISLTVTVISMGLLPYVLYMPWVAYIAFVDFIHSGEHPFK